jgi:hypothetical protein
MRVARRREGQMIRNTLLSAIAAAGLLLAPLECAAMTIATCGAQTGHSYYLPSGPVGAGDAGWQQDGVTGGSLSLVMNDNAEFDVIQFDASKKVISAVNDGAKVSPIRLSANEIAVSVYYPADTIEVYSFFRDAAGKSSLIFLQSRGSPNGISAGKLFVSECSSFEIDSLNAAIAASAAASAAAPN